MTPAKRTEAGSGSGTSVSEPRIKSPAIIRLGMMDTESPEPARPPANWRAVYGNAPCKSPKEGMS